MAHGGRLRAPMTIRFLRASRLTRYRAKSNQTKVARNHKSLSENQRYGVGVPPALRIPACGCKGDSFAQEMVD